MSTSIAWRRPYRWRPVAGTRFTELIGVELPIIQAPMAGFSGPELAAAVAEAGSRLTSVCVAQS
jgi:hypothetical protein